jgi:hypothetical protein
MAATGEICAPDAEVEECITDEHQSIAIEVKPFI